MWVLVFIKVLRYSKKYAVYIELATLKNVGAWRGIIEPSIRYVLRGAGACQTEYNISRPHKREDKQ